MEEGKKMKSSWRKDESRRNGKQTQALLESQFTKTMHGLSPPVSDHHLTAEGKAVEEFIALLPQRGTSCDVAEEIARAMAGLDINAPYSSSSRNSSSAQERGDTELLTAGHKLSQELVQHPHIPAAAKLDGIKATLGCGLDINARWREGRASGVAGATLLAGVLWLQGVPDDAKLDLVRSFVRLGLEVNTESIERGTKATSGTFVLAGAINCSSLQSESKAQLLSILIDAGLDLNAPCQQGKEPSTTGATLGARIATSAGVTDNHKISMLTTLVRGGWRPARLSASDVSKLAHVVPLSHNASLDPAVLDALQQEMATCAEGCDWSWAQGMQVRADSGPAAGGGGKGGETGELACAAER